MYIDKLTRESLAPYLPIPHGGRRVLVNVLMAIAAIAMIASRFALPDIHPYGILVSMVGTIMLTGQIILSFRDAEFGGDPTKWFKTFFVRNYVGYELWCRRRLYGDDTIKYEIHRRGDFLPSSKNVVIAVPLQPGAPCKVRIPDTAGCWWSMRTHDIALDDHTGMVVVEMRDQSGDRFKINVEGALRILVSERSTYEKDKLVMNHGSARLLVEGLMARLDETRSELANERIDRDVAVGELYHAAERIAGTKRFMESREAASIRNWLQMRFDAHQAIRPVPGSS